MKSNVRSDPNPGFPISRSEVIPLSEIILDVKCALQELNVSHYGSAIPNFLVSIAKLLIVSTIGWSNVIESVCILTTLSIFCYNIKAILTLPKSVKNALSLN